jgi:translation initiation factor IF-1
VAGAATAAAAVADTVAGAATVINFQRLVRVGSGPAGLLLYRCLPFRLVCEVLSADGTGHEQDNTCMKEEHLEIEGVVQTVLPGTMFRVQLDNKHLVLATISGKMRKRWVRLTAGDRVKMEMSPYDLDKARIVWRLR